MDGCPIERVALFPILHTQKNGSAVNPSVQAKMVSNFYENCIIWITEGLLEIRK